MEVRVKEREREKKTEKRERERREREIPFVISFPKLLPQVESGKGKAGEKAKWVLGPKFLRHPPLLSQPLSKEMDWKWSRRDLNWLPNEMLVSQAEN